MKDYEGNEIDVSEWTHRWRIDKDGRPIHDGDCYFWGEQICTCGLIHHWMWLDVDDEKLWEERGQHETQLDKFRFSADFERIPPRPPETEEKKAKRLKEIDKLVREVFGKDAKRDNGPTD